MIMLLFYYVVFSYLYMILRLRFIKRKMLIDFANIMITQEPIDKTYLIISKFEKFMNMMNNSNNKYIVGFYIFPEDVFGNTEVPIKDFQEYLFHQSVYSAIMLFFSPLFFLVDIFFISLYRFILIFNRFF